MPSEYVAFTDESGNTGDNLFDPSQPFFWTGTILMTKQAASAVEESVPRWALTTGVQELHGNELGFRRLDPIANEVHTFLQEYDCKLIFSRVEKYHLAATKFADQVLDSGINEAVSPYDYYSRSSRLGLTHTIAQNLELQERRAFWDAYGIGDAVRFRKVVSSVLRNLKREFPSRKTTTLIKALSWAKEHPEIFVEPTRSLKDSPNVVALTLLLQTVHKICRENGTRVKDFIHDQQQEFAGPLMQMYDLGKRFAFSEDPVHRIPTMVEVDTLDCPIKLADSKETPALQLVDIVLWLTKKYVDYRAQFPENCCEDLLGHIISDSSVMEISWSQLCREVEGTY